MNKLSISDPLYARVDTARKNTARAGFRAIIIEGSVLLLMFAVAVTVAILPALIAIWRHSH